MARRRLDAAGRWVPVSFGILALVSAMAMLGPLLALPRRWHLPLMLGELIAGVLLGPTGTGLLHAQNGTFMFVAGTHVPVRDERLRAVLRVGALRALGVGVLSVALAFGIASLFGTGHTALYAVLDGLLVGRAGPAHRRVAAAGRSAGASAAAPGGDRRRGLHRGAAGGHRSASRPARGIRRTGRGGQCRGTVRDPALPAAFGHP